MATKIINTRIQHKHDTEAGWLAAANFVPLAGELIIYDQDDANNQLGSRIKIGNGVDNVATLPFVEDYLALSMSPGSIQFDGYIGNKPFIPLQEEDSGSGILVRMGYVRIADVPGVFSIPLFQLDSEETIPAIMSASFLGESAISGCINGSFDAEASIIAFDELFIIALNSFELSPGSTLSPGVYTMCYEIVYEGHTMPLVVSSLYIPGMSFGSTVSSDAGKYFEKKEIKSAGDTLTWDGNTEGRECINGAYYKVSDVIPTLDDVKKGMTITALVYNDDGSTQLQTVSPTAEELEDLEISDDGVIGYRVLILTQPLIENDITYSAGVYFPAVQKVNELYFNLNLIYKTI